MKTSMQRFNVIMFLITLFFIQQYSTMEIGSIFNNKKTKVEDIDDFEQLCYYDLKIDLIIKNYVSRVKAEVEKIFDNNPVIKTKGINFARFFKIFQNGSYGKIATELASSEDYVRSYWNYFKINNTEKMTEKEFTKFMGLFYLEGELLIKEIHPTLTSFFPNEHNVNRRVACNIALAFWTLSNELLKRMFIEFKYSINHQKVTKVEIFTIITNTHTGKCLITIDKKCPYFTKFVGNVMGFFNMSAGSRDNLTTKETKIAYSTFLFSDIYDKECKQVKFDNDELQKKIKAIKFD